VPEGLGLSELLDEIVRALDLFLIDRTPASLFWDSLSKMRIEDLDTHRNGIVVADVTAQEFQTTYFLIEPSVVSTPLYDPDDPDTIESAVHAYFALPVGVRQEGGLRETRRFGVETGGGSGIRRLDDIDGG
jgi:hypothetical protein